MVPLWPLLLFMPALLTGCIPASDKARGPSNRSSVVLPNNAALRQCTSDLNRLGARSYPIARSLCRQLQCGEHRAIGKRRCSHYQPYRNAVPLGAHLCFMVARRCARGGAQDLWRSCRADRNDGQLFLPPGEGRGRAKRLSEHAFANAIDVSGFVLADGRRITVGRAGMRRPARPRLPVERSATGPASSSRPCSAPDYNAAHLNHLHFDLGRGPYCR